MIIKMLILFLGNFISVLFAIRKIIDISHRKNLFDEPTEQRKIHSIQTPNLGGVAVFVSIFLTGCVVYMSPVLANFNYLIAASIILFGLGLTDDLLGVDPLKKFLTQLGVALLVSCTTPIRFNQGLFPLLGIEHLSYGMGILLTSFFILFIMNAINLIDGINGLAGSLALLSSVVFSALFWKNHDLFFMQYAVALTASLIGFLYFNLKPARIFMGDTGSLFIGFMLAIFSIRILESEPGLSNPPKFLPANLVLIYALFIIPVVDTVKIIILRLVRRKSPFVADKNHVHHLLIDLGLSHMKATSLLLSVSISVLGLSCLVKGLPEFISLCMLTIYMAGFYFVINRCKQRKRRSAVTMTAGKFQTGKLRGFSIMSPGKAVLKSGAVPIEKVPG